MQWSRVRKSVLWLAVIFIAGVVLLIAGASWILSSMTPDYPTSPPMPPVVSASVDDLLAQYESFLRAKAPAVYAALQPGLTDAQIDALEAQYAIKLTDDLRRLYRWRNGVMQTSNLDGFPNHRFVPLDVALANRALLAKQVSSAPRVQRLAYERLVAYRKNWVGLMVDLAGDGFFFDPDRTEERGSFFFNFNEDGTYVFYPAFRNYLAAVIEGQGAGVFNASASGVNTADFKQTHSLWLKYGSSPP